MMAPRRPLLKACLNGGRSREQHPAVPVTAEELAAEAAAAVEAGADAVHVHPRAWNERESLHPDDIGAAVRAIREACPGVPVGVTTGAWIVRDAEWRLSLIKKWTELPDFASVNFSEDGAEALAEHLLARGVGVEAGLWTPADARIFVASSVSDRCLRVLIEPLDRDARAAVTNADAIEGILDGARHAAPRLMHGNRATTWPLLAEALRRGHDLRIGFEDTTALPDGSPAPGNAALVAAAVAMVDAHLNEAAPREAT